jgi:F-type H+-transporting ATPase subunit b
MLFVNFGILVFFYIRFAQKPLVNLLKGQGNKIGEQLQSIEADVKDARSAMESEAARLKNIDDNLANITKSIIEAGAREKDSIIERAQTVADKMVSDAKKEAEFKMLAAKKRFSEEMLDAAVKITAESIKKNITEEDDEKLVTAFSSDLGSEQNINV